MYDIFLKLNEGQALTRVELDKLRMWGNRMEADSGYVRSLQNGDGIINVNSIRSTFGEFRYNPTGLSSFSGGALSVVPNASPTDIPFENLYWDELRGFTNTTTFRIPADGKYQITAWVDWSTTAGGGYRQLKIRNTDGYMEEYDSRHSSVSAKNVNAVIGEVALRSGTDVSVELTQTSGGNLSASFRLLINLIRNYDGDIV